MRLVERASKRFGVWKRKWSKHKVIFNVSPFGSILIAVWKPNVQNADTTDNSSCMTDMNAK